MVCEIDLRRPCGSRSRSSNRYTRKEIEDIAKSCGLNPIKGVTLDNLCTSIIKSMQDAIKKPSQQQPNIVINKKQSLNQTQIAFDSFKAYFRKDLIGYLDSIPHKLPKFRIITSGGYGMKTLLETKYNIFNKVHTTDVDFTLSTYRSRYNSLRCLKYWKSRLDEYFALQPNPTDYSYKIINFRHALVPVLNYYRDYVIMIKYKDDEFVDIAITDQRITNNMIDKSTSLKAGIPIKNEKFYLKEFLSLIYMETVPGVNKFCYAKRNPVTGVHACKGIKDIERSQILCKLKTSQKYLEYCNLIQNATIDKLRSMDQKQRDKYFEKLKNIIVK